MISKKNQKLLLETARETILAFIENRAPSISDRTQKELLEKKACFVTLTKDGSLRGCIGKINPTQALLNEVQEKAVEAAFSDPRFSPLSKTELEKVKIEISVLSELTMLEFGSPKELLEKILPEKHGIILEKNGLSATFLPSVWKQLPEKQLFLSQLCMKAGLEPTAWQDKGIKVWVYTTESFEES